MTTIHAEIAADHQHIVLVAGGLSDPEEVAEAARRLKTLTPLFSKSDPPGALVVPATWPAVVQLAATFGDYWAPGPGLQAWIRDETARRMTLGQLAYRAPAGLTPRPYQIAGAQLIAATGRTLIFDEPRTGKTITTIIGLVERASTTLSGTGPALVICPASVVDPWVEAWQTWAPHVRAVAWRGSAEKRHGLAGAADVYVTSYETARIDTVKIGRKAPLRDLGATALVVDECHYIKNPQAERSKAVRTLAKLAVDRHGTVVALSGTPITHHPGDLWATLACIEPGAYPSRERWVNRYCDVVDGDYKDEILGLTPLREPEFRLTLLGQHRRVARADVMSQLPPKVYSVRTVELPAKWRKAYDAMESQMLAELPDGSELSVMGVLAQLTRLSQLSSAPTTITTATQVGPGPNGTTVSAEVTNVTLEGPSWKVDALLEILAERCGEDVPVESRDQVVCFAPSRQLIMLAAEAAEAAGYRVGYIVGGQSQLERTATRTAFQAGRLDLICATTGAGGTGITLSAAGTLVFLQRPWSLVESLQAEDRAEGDLEQTRGTEVIDVVARNTVDTRVRAVLRERAGQLAELVQDPRIVAELLGGVRLAKKEKAA